MSPNPEFSARSAGDLAAIEGVAADWMIRRDQGLAPSEERELARWLAADARHAAAFKALAATWQLLGEAPVAPAVPVRRAAKIYWLAPTLAAAAAAVAIAYVGWWRPGRALPTTVAPFVTAARTEIGALRKVELPDGSVIQLNTDSAIDVRFENSERRVRLARGEAHFSVAKDSRRPFIVSAGGVDVRVVGTVFNVRLRSESVDVLVTEGKVRVGSNADTEAGAISAGQRVSVALAVPSAPVVVAPVEVSSAEIKQSLAWQSRRLDFDATPLADIVAEINRYNRHKLVIDDARLAERLFGGSFPAGDYETLVRMLEANFEVMVDRKGDATRLRLKYP
jgi:transmembrane sensor